VSPAVVCITGSGPDRASPLNIFGVVETIDETRHAYVGRTGIIGRDDSVVEDVLEVIAKRVRFPAVL